MMRATWCYFFLVTFAASISCEVATLYTSGDVTLYGPSGRDDKSNSLGDNLVGVQFTDDPLVWRSLLKFNFNQLSFLSTANREGTLTAATMVLPLTRRSGSSQDIFFGIYPVAKAWQEPLVGQDGHQGGADASIGDVTWGYAVYNSDPWTSPGGDYIPVMVGAGRGIPAGTAPGTRIRVDLALSIIQAWIDAPTSHLGVLMKVFDEVTQGTGFRIADSSIYIEATYTSNLVSVTTDVLRDVTMYGPSGFNLEANAISENIVGRKVDGSRVWRTLMKFDFSVFSFLETTTNENLDTATLHLQVSRKSAAGTPGAIDSNIGIYVVITDWNGQTNTAQRSSDSGTAAQTGDVTWQYSDYSSQTWTTLGGDYLMTEIGLATLPASAQSFPYDLPVVLDTATVQGWIDNPSTHLGILIKVIDETIDGTSFKLYDATSSTPTRLTLEYLPSLDAGACCLGTTCTVESITTCTGRFNGVGSTCDQVTCELIPEACCATDGTCTDVDLSQCTGTNYPGQSCGVGFCPIILTPYIDALPASNVFTADTTNYYSMNIREVQVQLHSELPPTTMWTYNGIYPGPMFVVNVDQSITIEWTNDLIDFETGTQRTSHYYNIDTCMHGADAWGQAPRLSVHLHGIETTAESDGHPDRTFLPGDSYTYFYPNRQAGSLLWYHDHAAGITRYNTYLGLAGLYIIREAWEDTLLPSGPYVIPLFIQDKIFLPDGSLYYPSNFVNNFYGRKPVVNGIVTPYTNVARGKYRLRILNGSGSRIYKFYFKSSENVIPTFQLIGTDQGFLASPISFTEITLSPAERVDIILDFAEFLAGDTVELLNADTTAPLITQIMQFKVGAQEGWINAIPSTLGTPNFPDVSQLSPVVQSFKLEARGVSSPAPNCPSTIFMINRLDWDDVTDYAEMGTWQIWEFVNVHSRVHPMHVHLVKFRVLERQQVDSSGAITGPVVLPGDDEYYGWKDTVRALALTVTRVLMKFPDASQTYSGGLFPYHCHIIEHEDYSMMRQYLLVNPSSFCDNDGVCERFEDCQSCANDCGSSPGNFCGNGLCEAGDGENCVNCPADCDGSIDGDYCCSDGGAIPGVMNPVVCSTPSCTANGFACKQHATVTTCCGDGVCNGQESAVTCFIDCSIPSNNLCQATTLLSQRSGLVTGTNYHAGRDSILRSTDTCNSLAIGDAGFVWYSFNSGMDTYVYISTCAEDGGSSNYDTKLFLYSGSCGNLVCESGNDDSCLSGSQIFHKLTSQTDYFVLVGGANTLYDEGDFTFYYERIAAPVNDKCTSPIDISAFPSVVTGTTIGATYDVLPGNCFVPQLPTADVWYSFNSGENIQLTLNTCGLSSDLSFFLYSGDCTALTCISFSPSLAVCPDSGAIFYADILANTEYLFSAYSDSFFDFSFSIDLTPPPTSTATSTPTPSTSSTSTSTPTPSTSSTSTSTPTPSTSATSTATSTPTPSTSATSTATSTPTPSTSATSTATSTPTPSTSATSTATSTPTPSTSSTSTPTPSTSATSTATSTPTPSTSATSTAPSTPTPSTSATSTATSTPTPSMSSTATATTTPTPSTTSTSTSTSTSSASPASPSTSSTNTGSNSPSSSPASTPTSTATTGSSSSSTRTSSPSRSASESISESATTESRTPSTTGTRSRSITQTRTSSKSHSPTITADPVLEPSSSPSPSRFEASPSRDASESRTVSPSSSFVNETSATPLPNGNVASAELKIVLQPQDKTGGKGIFSTQSSIESLIKSELNNGADVTVIEIDDTEATVLICHTTEADLNNLLEAFQDETFRGTVLDGAEVDSVELNVPCDLSSVDLYSSSSNIIIIPVSVAPLLMSSYVLLSFILLLQ